MDERPEVARSHAGLCGRPPVEPLTATVHFFGDSFVAGFGDPSGLGWVGRVSAHAVEERTPFRAVNHGVPGATSRECVARWLRATDDPRNAQLPDTKVVFSFGTNDVIVGLTAEESL